MDSIRPDAFQVHIEEANKALDSPLTEEAAAMIQEHFKELSKGKGCSVLKNTKLIVLACKVLSKDENACQGASVGAVALSVIHKELRSLVEKFLSGQECIKKLGGKTTPKKEIESIWKTAARFIKGDMNTGDIVDVLKEIAKFPKEKRDGFSFVAAHFIEEGMSASEIAVILEAVTSIPVEEGVDKFVLIAAHFIKKGMSASEIALILKTVAAIPVEKERVDDFILIVERLIKEFMDGSEIAAILEEIARIPAEERESACHAAVHLITESMNGFDIICIVRQLAELSAEEREILCRAAVYLINKSMDGSDVVNIVSQVNKLPVAEREILCRAAAHLITESMNSFYIGDLLKKVSKIPAEERESTCSAIEYLMRSGAESRYLGDIFTAIARIPAEEREGACRIAVHLASKALDKLSIAIILEIVAEIPTAERAVLCLALGHLINKTMNRSEIINTVSQITKIPEEERESTCLAVKYLMKDRLNNQCIPELLESVSKISLAERVSICFAAACLIENSMDRSATEDILSAVKMISVEKRESTCLAVKQLIKGGMNKLWIIHILREVAKIPAKEREDVCLVASLFINGGMGLGDIESIVKVQSKEMLCKNLIKKLTDLTKLATFSKLNREKAVWMARTILSYQDLFKIAETHPLIKAAIGTILWLENKEDPFYVYAHMKGVRVKCTTSLAAMIEPINIVLSEPKGKVAVTLRLQGLQEALAELQKKGKDYLGLKTWIGEVNQEKKPTDPPLGPKIFVDLFRNLKERLDLEILANPTNSAELEELKANASRVEDNLTNPVFLTAQLMSAPFGADEVPVPRLTEKLYAIGAALLKEDNTPPQEGGLSPREELMMSALLMIEQCAEGQEGGITACYNALKVAQKIPGKVEEGNIHPGVEKTKEYLASELQKIMGEVLEAPKTLRQLGVAEAGAFNQGVHQSKYLKNMLGEECGLNHSTSLDPHGGLVSRSLMAHSRETIAGVFFQELSQNLVSSLKRDFNSLEPAPKRKLYSDLTDFFAQHKVNLGKAWSVESGDVDLTEFGALALLETGGCLLPLSGEYKHYLDLEDTLEAAEKNLRQLQSVKPVDPNVLAEAKNNKKNLEHVYVRAARTKDSTVSLAKEAFEKANVKLEELLTQEKLSKEASAKISLSTEEIELIKEQLSLSNNRLEVEAAIPEVRPPIAVIQDFLIQGNLPADIQDLETKWKIAESSLINRRGLLLSCEGELSKATEEVKVKEWQELVDRLNEEILELSKEVNALEEAFVKASEEYFNN